MQTHMTYSFLSLIRSFQHLPRCCFLQNHIMKLKSLRSMPDSGFRQNQTGCGMSLNLQSMLTIKAEILEFGCTPDILRNSKLRSAIGWPWPINPILHEGGHIVPTHIDDCMCCFCGCSKSANLSWLCSFQHLPTPIDAIFEKIEKFLQKSNFTVLTPLEKISKNLKKMFSYKTNHTFSM